MSRPGALGSDAAMGPVLRILGLDPGLRRTGWGVVEASASRLRHVADGAVATDERRPLPERLAQLHEGLVAILTELAPAEAAVEETFVNRNAVSTLKLGMARGVVLAVPALAGLVVAEYGANHIKKAIVGVGHAGKVQVQAMVRQLLPNAAASGPDAADALAAAICHAHHRQTETARARRRLASAGSGP